VYCPKRDGSAGAIAATWTYLTKDAPKFHRGHWINVGASVASMELAMAGILYKKWRIGTWRRERLNGLTEGEKTELGYRHPDFRYIS
jgi:hypothetical protein